MIPLRACLLGALLLASAQAPDSPWTVLVLDDPAERVALRDMDGDGDQDVVRIGPAGVSVRRMEASGRLAEDAELALAWPSEEVAWTLADTDGDGAHEVLLYVDARRVVRHRVGEAGFDAGETLLETRGQLPRGVFHMDFCRDVDGDGRLDVVLPAHGRYAIRLRRPERESGWSEPLEVVMQIDVNAGLGNPARLGTSFGQEVEIPWFTLEDVDGDGRRDLRAESDDRIHFHLAAPELAPEPTWTLDLDALQKELPGSDDVDLDDLLRMAGRQVGWRLVALDPSRPKDLVLQVGSKFRVYHGGSRTGPRGTPDQLLKSSGNVLLFFLRDADGDGRPDLQLLRGEGLSLARLIRWLFLPGDFELQLYTYANRAGQLATRPTRRNTITFEIPRLLALAERLEEREERRKNEPAVLARLVALDADGVRDDILDCRDGQLLFYRNGKITDELRDLARMEESSELNEILEVLLLDDLDRRGDGAARTLNLEELELWEAAASGLVREACAGLEPVHRVAVAVDVRPTSLHFLDLNADGQGDVVLVGREQDGPRYVQIHVVDPD